ncbi:MAG: type IIL restriction-modification enzyme MmeI [Solirubrobacterales bacterium]
MLRHGPARGRRVEQYEAGGFYDLIWPGVCLIEMKASSEAERLSKHRVQALGYRETAAKPDEGIPAPEYVVLCAFQRFEIWQPGKFPGGPRISFDLAELPDRFESLLFLLGDEPLFDANRAAVTIEAVGQLAELFKSLDERGEGGPDERHLFVLQCVWSMFAEDLDEIPNQAFTRIVRGLIDNPRRSSREDLGGLFRELNERRVPADGLYRGVPYANGRLFESQAALSLTQEELKLLEGAAKTAWSRVEPSIRRSRRPRRHQLHQPEPRPRLEPQLRGRERRGDHRRGLAPQVAGRGGGQRQHRQLDSEAAPASRPLRPRRGGGARDQYPAARVEAGGRGVRAAASERRLVVPGADPGRQLPSSPRRRRSCSRARTRTTRRLCVPT